MARYRYDPLPNIPQSIRLATIYPGVGDEEVIVDLSIETFSRDSPPAYEALSYVWGSTQPPEFICVGGLGTATLQVTANLKSALQHLRYEAEERVMWVDALCINQSDDLEKGAEVARMEELFACAAHVVVWLGPEADESGAAMERLAYISSQVDVDWGLGGMHRITPAEIEDVDRSIADPNSRLPLGTKQSDALVSLLNRDWFDRLWIRQDILVAEDKAFVYCGRNKVPWPIFRKALRLFYTMRPQPDDVVHRLGSRLQTIGGFVFQSRRTDVLSIRSKFGNALCSDPRDHIYAIKSLLLEDQQSLCGHPNYTWSTVDVYSEFTKNYIKRYPDGLTILRRCELSQPPHRWSGPSWVPDWSTKGSLQWGKDTYASSQIQGLYEFPEIGILRVLGVSPTKVEEVLPAPKFYYNNWREGVEFLRRITQRMNMEAEYPSGGSFSRAFARTLLCGAVVDFAHVQGGNYPTSQAAEAQVSRFVSRNELVEDDYKVGSDAQKFLKRMDWGSGGHNFIFGTGGYVGVAPPSAMVGDEVFVIVGCQQPLVLRKCQEDHTKYTVVGECYVEGCARAEPLLGNLPDHIGFSLIEDTASLAWSRRFMDLRSGEIFCEDPRLENLGVDLEEFRRRLAEDPEAMLSLSPELLRERISGLDYINLI